MSETLNECTRHSCSYKGHAQQRDEIRTFNGSSSFRLLPSRKPRNTSARKAPWQHILFQFETRAKRLTPPRHLQPTTGRHGPDPPHQRHQGRVPDGETARL